MVQRAFYCAWTRQIKISKMIISTIIAVQQATRKQSSNKQHTAKLYDIYKNELDFCLCLWNSVMSSNGICFSYKLRFKGILGVKWFPTVELNCKVQMTSDLFNHKTLYAEFIISMAYLISFNTHFQWMYTKEKWKQKTNNIIHI